VRVTPDAVRARPCSDPRERRQRHLDRPTSRLASPTAWSRHAGPRVHHPTCVLGARQADGQRQHRPARAGLATPGEPRCRRRMRPVADVDQRMSISPPRRFVALPRAGHRRKAAPRRARAPCTRSSTPR
jgi:hypothetical protein